jgi:alpha-tubulin suppressor-like RCC1 family protein
LGQNTGYLANLSSPVQVGALTDWAQISSNETFCAAVKTNGTLWSWGGNSDGELGQNISYSINRSSPVQVGALTDWSQVSAGGNFCVAVKTNGTLWSWGLGTFGRLGQDNTVRRSSPVQVGALTDWAQASARLSHCVAIKTNNTLWSWGRNQRGQLGQNNVIDLSSPVQVGSLTSWTRLGRGRGEHTLVIKT